jgi:hypothetical protein
MSTLALSLATLARDTFPSPPLKTPTDRNSCALWRAHAP